MNMKTPVILTIASLAILLPKQVSAEDLKEAKVTQVIQDVKVLPSNAAPRAAAVNDNVHQGTAVQTGVQSRSELTFKDKTITRLGEKTIFSVGEGARTIDLGSGQFLLYVPKKAGGAKVKMGPRDRGNHRHDDTGRLRSQWTHQNDSARRRSVHLFG
jgi:hypothetical protein